MADMAPEKPKTLWQKSSKLW